MMQLVNRLWIYARLMRVHRPIGIFLLLWPTLWALWIAGQGHPDWPIVFIFACGVFIMRSAGDVINDYADRNFDAHVARTKDRPLATGEATPREALILFCVLVLIAFGLVLFLNLFTILLAPVGLALAILYPFTKRYTYWPQAILGAAYSWSIPMAFAAQTNHIPPIAWLIYITAILWVLMYDTLYAMVDREDDKKIGIKSTALLFGKYDRLIIGLLQFAVIVLLSFIGVHYLALLGATLLFMYQQFLIKDRKPDLCFKAFLNNSWVGFVLWLGLIFNLYRGQVLI